MSKRKHVEDQIQEQVAQHLRARATPGVVWFHPPNGGHRNVREAVRLKRAGVRSGVSDIIAYHNREAFALELKAPGGRATAEQLAFLSEWREAGGHGVVAEGFNEAIMILESWGLLQGRTA